jgi:hypothetical protein
MRKVEVIPDRSTTKDGVKNSQATKKGIRPRENRWSTTLRLRWKEEILKGHYKINIKVGYRGDKGKGDDDEKHNPWTELGQDLQSGEVERIIKGKIGTVPIEGLK